MPRLGQHQSERTKRLLSRIAKKRFEHNPHPFLGKHLSDEHKLSIRKSMLGHKCSENTKRFLRKLYKGKPLREETKQKMREAALSKTCPRFNPFACQVIDEYGKKHGYNFQHALNGGEFRIIGYSVDGYDKDKNVVIEYYENRHKKTLKSDAIRKERIVGHLGCKFIEIKEWEHVQ